jgi:hypothetical protein
MISSILSLAASLFSGLATILNWKKQQSDQNIGRQIQANDDAQATIKEATDAQKIDAAVATDSRDALVNELRGPTTPAA